VLTKDDRIRHRPAELEAYRSHKVRVFIFGSGEMKAQEMAEAVATAIPKILRLVRRTPRRFSREFLELEKYRCYESGLGGKRN